MGDMSYIDTVYGHQSHVTSLDACQQVRPLRPLRTGAWLDRLYTHAPIQISRGTRKNDPAFFGLQERCLSAGVDRSLRLWKVRRRR